MCLAAQCVWAQLTMKVWNMVLAKYTICSSLGIPCIFTSHHISGVEIPVWQVHEHMQLNLRLRYQLSGELLVQTAWRHSHIKPNDVAMRLALIPPWTR